MDFGSSVPDSWCGSHLILFNTISNFCGLKRIDINKANTNMNYQEYKKQHWIYFPSPKENRLQKQNMFEPCDVICHVTCLLHSMFIVSLMHWLYTCDTSLDAHRRQLQQLCAQQFTTISKKLKKSQTKPENVTNLSCTLRNCHARKLKSLSVHHSKITKILAPSRLL
jgi:hypothetical protein